MNVPRQLGRISLPTAYRVCAGIVSVLAAVALESRFGVNNAVGRDPSIYLYGGQIS